MESEKSNGTKAFPQVIAAFFCEKVLTEPDGVVSAIRIVDIVQLPERPKAFMKKAASQGVGLASLFFVMMIRAGNYRGKIAWEVYSVSPSGKKTRLAQRQDVDLGDSPEKGLNVAFPVGIKWEKQGLYRFDIYVNKKRMTRSPLVIKVVPAKSAKTAAEEKKPEEKKPKS